MILRSIVFALLWTAVVAFEGHQHAFRTSSRLAIDKSWHALGPWQIGTREAAWGHDPLSILHPGGFHNLTYDSFDTFPSSLNGTVGWRTFEAEVTEESGEGAQAKVEVVYEDIDWDGLTSAYGWAALQFSFWIRGTIHIEEEGRYRIHALNVGEIWIDGKLYDGGDWYAYRRAPLILTLSPGEHRVEIRAINEIRIFGGRIPPKVEDVISVQRVAGGVVVEERGIVTPDVVEGRSAGEWVSVGVRNEGEEWVDVVDAHIQDAHEPIGITFEDVSVSLAPGQIRPIKFRVRAVGAFELQELPINITVHHRTTGLASYLVHSVPLTVRPSVHSPHKFTYLHPSNIVSYSILRPPSLQVQQTSNCSILPVVVSLHGAGVEASSPMWTQAYDDLPDLPGWLVMPAGVTSWGDDWHRWSFGDAEAAARAVKGWMDRVAWEGVGADEGRWVLTGHSNGGQGVWNAITHPKPGIDIVCAAPIAGYYSIQAYVPYMMWEANHEVMSIINEVLSEYDASLYVNNVVGTKVLARHGSADDNVPVYHSRRMVELLRMHGVDASLDVVKGESHWWDGVMTAGRLGEFLIDCLGKSRSPVRSGPLSKVQHSTAAQHAFVKRQGRQAGHIADVIDTPDTLTVVIPALGQVYLDIASDIVRGFYNYFGMDVRIAYEDQVDGEDCRGNVIALGNPDQNSIVAEAFERQAPAIQAMENGYVVGDAKYSEPGTGVIFAHPYQGRLMLSIAGLDEAGLRRAARLVPYRTGSGQPDFAIVGEGIEIIKGLGFFDEEWKLGRSYLSK
ncbi:alpha/beta-hydrolase [Saitoella complicata NRRL Y-17804]|uniref:Peptidase S9 prolyl oligopeptidase catalytic domain-containing protein n=1 Tax=Saitoella complicata (strain BCRC 22490 / CBS 7301 / JCM 7358 / NBRC 10748 / NRRL Y-17804) TaxID=698492 RepID=A0A0E9N961_SAICN|nr:alpha/beta-hydrolase [Saitoella complicata NRRL Y-17804]ODQ53287.1 alpha/beta-hydrolase [Saitoella complicata NRRL Y-17804]GAO46412.1 hypothetical protein G7K_0643-t1 [Saitoella complicata NRRL Y-17804]